MASLRPSVAAVVIFVVVVGLGAAAMWNGGPPAPLPATAPATEFSAERAMAHVERIGERPHSPGLADHARVRDYVAAAFERLGLKPQLQAATVIQAGGRVTVGRVENVLVRIPGTASTGAALLASHYDSVGAGPGAADDAAAVAALIEATRAVKAGGALRNDLIVLVTDDEEASGGGALAFVEQHPWAKDVRAILNFEARGTSGPVQMFETGPQNGLMVAAWAQSVPHPTGSSLAYEIYKLLPNDTDFSTLKRLGVAGLNFAFIGDPDNYHTPHDNPPTLDRGSLQHHGAIALALARRLGGSDLAALRAHDAVYFSLPILFMVVRYPVTWALPLAVLLALVYVWAVVRARRRRLASLGGVLAAFVIFAVFGALAGFWGWRFSRLMTSLHTRWLAPGSVGNSAPYAALLASVVVTSWCACYALLRRWFAPHSLLLGSAFVWIVLAVVAAWFVPGGSYVLLWPAAASLLSSVALAGPGERGASVGAGRVLLIGILSVPTSLIIWPLVVTLFIAMGLAPESGVALALLTLFGLAALSAPLEVITDGRRWWPAGAALVAACACLGTGIAVTPYSAVHPRAVNMFYVLDADTQTAEWTTKMDGPDAWASQYLGAKPVPGRPRAVLPPWWSSVDGAPGWLKGEAPLADLPAPAATIISSASVEDGQDRTLTLHVKPAAEGHALSVWTNGAPVMEAAIDGKPLKLSTAPRAAHDTRWSVDFVNAAGDGATITLTLRSLAKLTVAVLDRSAGLPAITGKPFGPRPPSIVPINFGDSTFVRRTYTF